MFGLVDVVVSCAHPAGEDVSQRTGDGIGNRNADKTADEEETDLC